MQENNQTNNTPEVASGSTDLGVPTNEAATQVVENITTKVDSAETPTAVEVMAEVVKPADDSLSGEVSAVAAKATDVVPSAISSRKQMLTQYGIAAAIVLLMGAGLAYALEQQGRINTGVFAKISELVNPAPAAALVNGTKITMADYQKNLDQLTNAATQQNADVTNESVMGEIKKQAIDVLVNTELLRQEARKGGITVTAEEVEARYQEIIESLGGEDKLIEKMNELAITEESLRKDIEGEILIQGHLQKAVDTSKVVISDEDLKAAYEQISKGATTPVPPLAEIKDQLAEQLKFNKEQELVNAYITSLREGSAVEVLI